MKTTRLIIAAMLSTVLLLGTSCSKENESSGETKISATNGNKSHNAGENCMTCHVSGGQGEGQFVAAGTVYNSTGQSVQPNAIITLTTGENGTGTVRATLYGDAKGNFYTTAAIDFSGGLYPSVKSTTGTTSYMSSTITQAACNGCHTSGNRILAM
jgi:hypothetical protein